jgi:CO/xanthine dehydrogenase Mo-binding subunit/aerobic-type carbon monoxide dehydrogenase small subunit (CoxS/CutS family)
MDDLRRTITLTVNGLSAELAVNPAKRLSEVLREDLGLTGTKIGCHAGDCGACTVLVGERQVCACLMPAAQAAEQEITTVEGLAEAGQLNALQRAFLRHGAAQCGICTPGMLMAATALLRRNASPTEAEVQAAIGGVLCRCTGYRQIVAAILDVNGDARVEEPESGQAVGRRIVRLDGPDKLTGRAKYGADVWPADSLSLRIVRSPYARARFAIGDLHAFCAKFPAIVAVLTAQDVPENSFSILPDTKDQPVLADGHARFRGEAVLCLVGEAEALAAIPEAAMPLEWFPGSPLQEPEQSLAATGDLIHDFAPENVLCRGRVVKGNVERALKASAYVAEADGRTPYIEHAYIEPEAGYAEVFADEKGERLRIFGCTQTPYMDRDEVAHILKIPPDRVHIVPSAMGGGFGGKLDVAIQPLIALAAWKLKRPVRHVYPRPESMVSTVKRHPAHIRARMGCDAQGILTAIDFAGDFNTGAYASFGSTVANRVPVHASGPYVVPAVRALTRAVYTNNAIAGAFRGFGVPQTVIVTEALVDQLANAAGIDRLEFRHRNAIRAGQSTATGQRLMASAGLAECLERLRPSWQQALEQRKVFNSGAAQAGSPLRRGVGIACMWYGIGNTVIANPSTMAGSLRRTGRLFLYNGAQEIGQGTATILPQIFADAVGLPVAMVDQVMGDTDLTADAGKSSASRQTFVSGNAAKFAGEELRRVLLKLVDASQDARLSLEGAVLVAREGTRERRVELAKLPVDEHGDVARGQGYFNPPTVPLDANGQGVPYASYAFGAQMAELEVDRELGTVRLIRIHAAHDVGRAINPTLVDGQICGGVAQGIGFALMEEYVSGRTDNLHDYLIPTSGDVPPILIHLIEAGEPLGPFGAKGVGEPALIPTAPAILGAIDDAVGVRLTVIPATPSRVRAALRQKYGAPEKAVPPATERLPPAEGH